MPRNLDTVPRVVPVKVALSSFTVGAALRTGLAAAMPAWKAKARRVPAKIMLVSQGWPCPSVG